MNYSAPQADRFLEIHNPSSQPVNLLDYAVDFGEEGGILTSVVSNAMLPAGGYLVITEPLEDGPSGVGITPRYGRGPVVDGVTWGGGGTFALFREGSDADLVDPDTGPSPLGNQGISRCGPDTNFNSENFRGAPLSAGAVNQCANLQVNEVDYNVPAGGAEFIEVINTGLVAVDLFDYRFAVHINASTRAFGVLDARGTMVAPGGRAVVCLGAGGPTGCPMIAPTPRSTTGPVAC